MSAGEHQTLPTCQRVIDCLPEWLEGGLAGESIGPLLHHLQRCSPCADLARTYRAVGAVARQALALEMPGPARERLRRILLARGLGR